jgi:outer membrane protein TolC
MRSYLLLLAVLCGAAASAQETTNLSLSSNNLVTSKKTPTADAPLFFTPTYFKKTFENKTPRVELQAPVRIADFVADGRIELSLKAYLEGVLANNTDIAVQRLSVEIPRNAILRGYSIFDPSLLASFNSTRRLNPASDVLAGADVLNVLTQPATFRYAQMLPTGTSYTVGFDTTKVSTNSAAATFNPALNSNLAFSFSQPLLRGRGTYYTKLPITIARSRLRQGEYDIQDQILQIVSQAEQAYWDVVLARENLAVQEQTLKLFDTSLKRSQRELELGAISQLEIYQPQAEYANAEIQVSQARFRLAQTEDAVRRFMGVDLDPKLRELPIVLTEAIPPPSEIAIDKEGTVAKALRLRPDLQSNRQALDVDDLTIRSASNALKPDLSLTGQYGSSGRGGVFYPRNNIFSPDGTRTPVLGSPVPGGFGDALDQLFGFGYPVYGFGLRLNLPLRDRRASADYADAVVNKRLDTLRVRSAEQQTRLQVLNAINQVEGSRANVELAKVALDLAEKRAAAEQKKFDLGTSIMYFVLDAQAALSRAQTELTNQSVNYRKNLTNLLRVTGDLLPERGIAIQ